jgi:hypothetical protein
VVPRDAVSKPGKRLAVEQLAERVASEKKIRAYRAGHVEIPARSPAVGLRPLV